MNKVWVLVGTSSVGKSSIAKMLQNKLGEDTLFFSTDDYMKMLDEKYNNFHPNNPKSFIPNNVIYAKKMPDGTFDTITGSVYQKLYKTIPTILNNIANNKLDIVVDSLINTKTEIQAYKEALKNQHVKFIYLQALPETLIKREKTRSDRVAGSALNWLKKFDCKEECDMVIDTDEISVEQIAQKIPL